MRYGEYKNILKAIGKREKAKAKTMALAFRIAQSDKDNWNKNLAIFD